MEAVHGKDRLYAFNDEATNAIREAKAWMKDPTYFKRVKISPSASIKMMSHCQSGVDKGIKNNGNPIEVMGFLLGHPDSEDPHAFIISDAQVWCDGMSQYDVTLYCIVLYCIVVSDVLP